MFLLLPYDILYHEIFLRLDLMTQKMLLSTNRLFLQCFKMQHNCKKHNNCKIENNRFIDDCFKNYCVDIINKCETYGIQFYKYCGDRYYSDNKYSCEQIKEYAMTHEQHCNKYEDLINERNNDDYTFCDNRNKHPMKSDSDSISDNVATYATKRTYH